MAGLEGKAGRQQAGCCGARGGRAVRDGPPGTALCSREHRPVPGSARWAHNAHHNFERAGEGEPKKKPRLLKVSASFVGMVNQL